MTSNKTPWRAGGGSCAVVGPGQGPSRRTPRPTTTTKARDRRDCTSAPKNCMQHDTRRASGILASAPVVAFGVAEYSHCGDRLLFPDQRPHPSPVCCVSAARRSRHHQSQAVRQHCRLLRSAVEKYYRRQRAAQPLQEAAAAALFGSPRSALRQPLHRLSAAQACPARKHCARLRSLGCRTTSRPSVGAVCVCCFVWLWTLWTLWITRKGRVPR
jgi:hypothetical protein